jgi:hypothetical protein
MLRDRGQLVEQRIRITREGFADVFEDLPRAGVLLEEASTEGEWVAR